MKTSKSPNQIALVAYRTAQQSLPAYSSKYSPKKFTLHQLAACLVLKAFFETDYRGIAAILEDSSDLRKILELTEDVPHFTTLQKASSKICDRKTTRKLVHKLILFARREGGIPSSISMAAIDSTGLESHHISSYFVHRRADTESAKWQFLRYSRYPKLDCICDCRTHLILSSSASRGPAFDGKYYTPLLEDVTKQGMSPKTLLADAGYDSEYSHTYARERYGIRTIIPARRTRSSSKLPKGRYRRLMATRFPKALYGQRWQVETVFSMIKRNLGSFLSARTYWSQCREISLRVFTHNIMVVRP